jgi:lipoprotein-anchoring transpeptidase ErfK/SrfK
MRSRTFVLVALLLAALLVGSAGVYAYDRSRAHTIANGVTVANVAIGGMSTTRAEAKLRRVLLPRLSRPVVVTWPGRRFVLTATQAGLRVDLPGTVGDALSRSRSGSILTRTARNLRGQRLSVNLEPQISYSPAAVRGLVGSVGRAVNRPARDATVSFGAAGPRVVPSRAGARLQAVALRRSVETALATRTAARHIAARTVRVPPRTTAAEVARRYPVVLTLNRAAFQLSLYKHLKLVKTYTVAVGQQGLETPAGLYHIQNKEVDPSWHVPNSAWAGSLAGQVVPPGPDDPIKARWLGIFDGAGIHGTDETWSLGHAASHGCVRMAISDVIELYPQVAVGTPIYIG